MEVTEHFNNGPHSATVLSGMRCDGEFTVDTLAATSLTITERGTTLGDVLPLDEVPGVLHP